MISSNLRKFLSAYLSWVEAGAPDDVDFTDANPYGFDRSLGLCGNAESYAFVETGANSKDWYAKCEMLENIKNEMKPMFATISICDVYPFNDGHAGHYLNEMTNDACWQNEARIQWVRSTLEVKE